ncbi:MAG TPA: DUF3471 domain-containing protein [Gemmatimonadaceae bacterium]|jgi:uncharacterized damage-inducible protein DinB|nr:DUF3471 domain-containing protein [Gemmatimonadaceae bacterium]
MVRIRSIIVGALFPAALIAQSSSSDKGPNNIRASFAYFAEHYGRLIVAALDSIPATKYGFSPTPAQQTVGYIAQHLEDANFGLCSRLGRPDPRAAAEWRISDSVRAKWPKDTLVARVRASIVFCTAAIGQLNDRRIGEVATMQSDSGRTILPARVLLAFTTDLAEHYAQLASYMRQLGLVPPSAAPPSKARVAIDLPVSTLAAYAGKYNLSPAFAGVGVMLDVHVRNGALYLTPSGQPEARLWPESATDFFFREIDAQVSFTRNASGVVTGLVLHQGGENRVGPKVK